MLHVRPDACLHVRVNQMLEAESADELRRFIKLVSARPAALHDVATYRIGTLVLVIDRGVMPVACNAHVRMFGRRAVITPGYAKGGETI